MEGYESQLIMFLLSTLVAVTGGALRFVLKRNEKLENIVDANNLTLLKNNEALAEANKALAVMVQERTQQRASDRAEDRETRR